MKALNKVISVLIGCAFLWSCDDVFEKDLQKERIVLTSPGDSALVNQLDQTFYWEALEGARSYRFQIASGSFNAPTGFYLDSTISGTQLPLVLSTGIYQWRVQGLNAGYSTPFTTHILEVDSSATFGAQKVELISPSDQYITNQTLLEFAWEPMPTATKYIFHLDTNPAFDTIIYTTQVIKRLPNTSGTYTWKVTAINARDVSDSDEHSFQVDLFEPTIPLLVNPAISSTFMAYPINLTWSRSSNDVLYDSLYLYHQNSTTLMSGFPRKVNAETFSITAGSFSFSPGPYYWAVRSVDRAGNSSPLSEVRLFNWQ